MGALVCFGAGGRKIISVPSCISKEGLLQSEPFLSIGTVHLQKAALFDLPIKYDNSAGSRMHGRSRVSYSCERQVIIFHDMAQTEFRA